MNTKSSETNESNKFIYQFTSKLNLKNPNKNMTLANLSIHGKTLSLNTTTINLEFLLQFGMMNLICLMDQFFDIQDYFEYIIKKHETIADNPPVQIYVNKIKNRIAFLKKTGCKLELLSKETMQLLGSLKK